MEEQSAFSLFLEAASKNDVEKIRSLIEQGMDVNTTDKNGKTALMCVAENNAVEAAELLIEYGADVNTKDNEGWTPLMYASRKNTKEVRLLLIKHGADINAVTKEEQTALDIYANGITKKTEEDLLQEKIDNLLSLMSEIEETKSSENGSKSSDGVITQAEIDELLSAIPGKKYVKKEPLNSDKKRKPFWKLLGLQLQKIM